MGQPILLAKIEYLACRMRTIRELCGQLTDDYVQRIVARDVYLCLDSFIDFARQLKNTLPRASRDEKSVFDSLHDRLNKLDADYESPPGSKSNRTPNLIRDKVAAHRQLLPLSELLRRWEDHDDVNINVLVDDVVDILKEFDAALGSDIVNASVPPNQSAAAIAINERFRPAAKSQVTSDDLALTQQGMVSAIALGPFQAKMQAVTGVMRRLKKLAIVSDALSANCDMHEAAVGMWIVEAFNFIDNVFDDTKESSVLTRCKAEKIKGAPLLDKLAAARDHKLEQAIREVRDHFGAHLDDKMTLADIKAELHGAPIEKFGQYLSALATAYVDVLCADIRTKHFTFIEQEINGFTVFKHGAKPYNSKDAPPDSAPPKTPQKPA